MSMIRLLPYLIFIAILAGQALRIPLSKDSSASLLLIDVAISAYTGIGLVYILMTRKSFHVPISGFFMLTFCIWIIATLIFGSRLLSQQEILIATFYAIRFFIMIGALIVSATLYTNKSETQKITSMLVVTGIALALLGFVQIAFFPDFASMAQYGWDPHQGRLLSTFFDPNFFGMFLVIIASLTLSQIVTIPKAGFSMKLIFALILVVTAIGLTYSRSAYLALLVSFFIILAIRVRYAIFIGALCLFLVSMSVPRIKSRIVGALRVDSTAQDRIESWNETFAIIKDNPVMGVGYNAFGPTAVRYKLRRNLIAHSTRGSDSSLLLIMATTGIVGLTLYSLFFIFLIGEAVSLYRLSTVPYFRSVALAMVGIIPSYLVHSQFVNSLLYPLVFIPFALLVSVIWIETKKLKQQF